MRDSLSILFWANGKTSRNRGKKKTIGEINKWLNKIKGEDYPWFYEITKIDPEDAIMDLQKAFNNYYKKKPNLDFHISKQKSANPCGLALPTIVFRLKDTN